MSVTKSYSNVDNKLQISSLTHYDSPLVQAYTLEELKQKLNDAQTALKSWEDAKVLAEENIEIQNSQIEKYQNLIDEAVKQGIVEVQTEVPTVQEETVE